MCLLPSARPSSPALVRCCNLTGLHLLPFPVEQRALSQHGSIWLYFLQELSSWDPPVGSQLTADLHHTAWRGGQEKRAAGMLQGPETLPFVVVWFLPGCPCKTFMKMLLYLHRSLKIAVNLAKSPVPQECGMLRKCLWPSLLDGRSTAAAACTES